MTGPNDHSGLLRILGQEKDMTEPRWYCVTSDGAATLCVDRADAEQNAADADIQFPRRAPHRAVQLVELAALESAQECPLGAAIAPEHDEAMAQMAADAERAHAEMVRDAKLWRAAQERQGEAVTIEAVAIVKRCPTEGLRLDWLIEGGIAAFEPGEVLMISAAKLTDDEGSGEVYLAPQPLRELSEEEMRGLLPMPSASKIYSGEDYFSRVWDEEAVLAAMRAARSAK